MFDRFTDGARKVMALARKAAQRFNHDFIGTEHILLGLLQEGGGAAARVLRSLGIDHSAIRSRIEAEVKSGPVRVTMGQLPFTPRAKGVLELSVEESEWLGHEFISTAHLLLGLLRENDGLGAQVLLEAGVTIAETLKEVDRAIASEAGRPPAPKPQPPAGSIASIARSADERARRSGHGFVGTGHLLLALLEEQGGAARRILEGLGVSAERLGAESDRLAAYDLAAVAEKQIPFLPQTTAAINRSHSLARSLERVTFGSDHLLLALLAPAGGPAAQILADLGLDFEEARRRVCENLGLDPERARRLLEGSHGRGLERPEP